LQAVQQAATSGPRRLPQVSPPLLEVEVELELVIGAAHEAVCVTHSEACCPSNVMTGAQTRPAPQTAWPACVQSGAQ
jgi:hypothetical protein